MENKNFWQQVLELILSFLKTNKPAILAETKKVAVKEVSEPVKPLVATQVSKNKLTVEQWATSCGRYPARANSPELTDEVKKNAEDLLKRVADFLDEIGWDKKLDISSGFRTSAANSATSNAAKKSSHMTGKAVDLMDDKDQALAKKVESHPDLLRKHGLMMEDKAYTKGKYTNWCHLDTFPRADRPSRTFKP